MSVAQLNMPERPIAVGNRQHRDSPQHNTSHYIVTSRILRHRNEYHAQRQRLSAAHGGHVSPTHHQCAPLRRAARRVVSHLNEYLPSAGCLRATCGSQEPQRMAATRYTAPRTVRQLNATAALRGGIPKRLIVGASGCRRNTPLLGTMLRAASQSNDHTTTRRETMAFESTPARMAIRDKLIDQLLAVPIEGTITHGQIAKAIGAGTTSPDAIKHAAMRIVAEEHGAVFENVRGTGYRRIPASDIHRIGHSARQGIRNKARRSSRKMMSAMTVNSNSMTSKERLRVHSEIGIMGIIQMSAGRGAANKAMRAAEAAHSGKKSPPSHDEIARAVQEAFRSRA